MATTRKSITPVRAVAVGIAAALFSMLAVPLHTTALTNPNAQSTGFQAKIPADPPTVAATIATPVNGQTIATLPVRVSGLCTGDVLVKVFSNGVFVGSAQCINGAYSLSVDLFSGVNDLVVRVYDALDQVGPDSATVSVNFTQGGFNQNGPRIALTSTYAKRGANPGETLSWPIILSGGRAPYAVSVDWGDGTTQLISRALAGEFNITHEYKSPGVYTVIVKASDADGTSAFMQLVGVGNGALAQDTQETGAGTTVRTVYVWWPLMIAAGLIVVSFWLGNRSKLMSLRRQADQRIQY